MRKVDHAFQKGSQHGIKLGLIKLKLEMYGQMRGVEVLLGSPCEYRLRCIKRVHLLQRSGKGCRESERVYELFIPTTSIKRKSHVL